MAQQLAQQLMRSPKALKTLLLFRKQLVLMNIRSDQYHGRSKIGKREVVGYGVNGEYSYIDTMDTPMPAIRFREENEEIRQLREKEKQNWSQLTIDEKKKCKLFVFCITLTSLLFQSKVITIQCLNSISI